MSKPVERDHPDDATVRAGVSPTLRPVRDDDVDFLLRLYSSTREDISRAPWSEEQKQGFLYMQYAAQRADYERRFPKAAHSIVLVGVVPVGRIWVDRRADEIRLLDVALMPERCGRGIGAALLGDLMEEARRCGKPLRHSVLKENVRALRFYRRLGFVEAEDLGMYVLMERVGADGEGPSSGDAAVSPCG